MYLYGKTKDLRGKQSKCNFVHHKPHTDLHSGADRSMNDAVHNGQARKQCDSVTNKKGGFVFRESLRIGLNQRRNTVCPVLVDACVNLSVIQQDRVFENRVPRTTTGSTGRK